MSTKRAVLVLRVAVGSGLLGLASVAGCFHSLDREDVKCQLGDQSTCPIGYECRETNRGPRCHNLESSGGVGGTMASGGSGPVDAAASGGRDGAPDVHPADAVVPADAPLRADTGEPDLMSGSGGGPGAGGRTVVRPGTGGAPAAGGNPGRGGALGKGGAIATGGRPGTGGALGYGGATLHGTNPQITGSSAYAKRLWDCCKPSCANWTDAGPSNLPSCGKDGVTRLTTDEPSSCYKAGAAHLCYDLGPWYDPVTNMSYGFAYNHLSRECGACYMLQFTGEAYIGEDNGVAALAGQQMIVQAIGGIDVSREEFDLLIPGAGEMYSGSCGIQWDMDPGEATKSGGLLSACSGDKDCLRAKCSSTFATISDALIAGCAWSADWFNGTNTARLVYQRVNCPEQLVAKSGISAPATTSD